MKVLMSFLYGARCARFDLLRCISGLASRMTSWDTDCDKRLHRLVCYVYHTLHYRMVGYVGNNREDVQVNVYADADFAGCKQSAKSTTGGHIAIQGPFTCFPLMGVSKKQDCVSSSTPEAELVAGAWMLRREGLPALDLWDLLLGPKPNCASAKTTRL